MIDTFKAFVVEESGDNTFKRSIKSWSMDRLPDHEVLIRVSYSSLNYKDALSASGNKGVTKQYPHIPGIDAAGIVEKSGSPEYSKGDRVLVTGYDLGQNTFGGYAEYIRVPAKWVVPLPENLSLRESMILGTAGFTAAIGVHHLRFHNISPESGTILVTGATGGVGTMATAILGRLNYAITAATGKVEKESYLKELGASTVIHRDEVQDESGRFLLSSKWAGTIDTVGGIMLDTAIRQTAHNGVVACCGNILGHELNTNVYPFILRGVTLAGMDSGNCLMDLRKNLWDKLSHSWKPEALNDMATECSLEQLDQEIEKILNGKQVGRVIVNLKS